MNRKGLWILLKKNLIVERRTYKKTILEVLIILKIFLAIILLKSNDNKASVQNKIILDDLSLFRKHMDIQENPIPYKLYFTPNTEGTQKIFQKVVEKLQLNGSESFENEIEMIQNFKADFVLAAIVYEDNNLILRFPNYFRTRSNINYYRTQDFWLTKCFGLLDAEDYYAREGFLALLYTIITTQIEMENNTNFVRPLSFSSMNYRYLPKVECVNDISGTEISWQRFFLWSLYYFLYFVPFLNLLWKFSREHEDNILVHHKTYGLTNCDHRLAHFFVSLLHLILLDLLVFAIVVYSFPSLNSITTLLIWVFLILYNCLLIIYAMVVATFWANAKTSLWFGIALWITSYSIFAETLNTTNFNIIRAKILIISLINFNNLIGNSLLDYFGKEENSIEIIKLLGIQIVIIIFYLIMLKYVDYIKPGCYVKRFNKTNSNLLQSHAFHMPANLNYENTMEYEATEEVRLELKRVFSNYRLKKKPKLLNISMKFYKNEISVILGAHCSGKTSLISILAGWQTFQGYIFYENQDIMKNWLLYRQNFDISMPNNNLYDLLTITETLKYFILLKQSRNNELNKSQLNNELNKWTNVIRSNMDFIKHKLVKNLTFEEKRILILCCTLLCNTSVILLDEPTLHMTAEYQMKYWNILKQEKQNRVIILTTCSIDEASEIADRIGILNDGSLIAWATPYYLRKNFGSGVYLICLLEPMKPIKNITQILQFYIPNLKIHQHFSDRVIYILPWERKAIFQRLLIELEKDFTKLGIIHIYMMGSSLNDVYMSLTLKQDENNSLADHQTKLKFLQEKKFKKENLFISAIFYKKLCQQAKNYLPISIILVSCFLIILFDQICSGSLNVDRIIVYENVLGDGNNYMDDIVEINKDVEVKFKLTHMAILNDNNDYINNGLLVYKNMKLDKASHYSRVYSMSAMSIDGLNRSVWYNHGIFHSTILALHMAFDQFNKENMMFTNKPIDLQANHNIHIILGIIMPLTMSVVFVILQEERFNHMEILQRIAGLNDWRKWLVTFLWDFLIYSLIAIFYLFIIISWILHFITITVVMAALFLFFINGIASLLFVYIMFLIIKEDHKCRAFLKILLIQLILGLFLYVLYINIFLETCQYVIYIFMISPGFSTLHGMNRILNNKENQNFLSYFVWQNPGILDSICYTLITTLIYFIIFMAIIWGRSKYRTITPKRMKTMASVCYSYEDDRVVKEKVRISNMNIKSRRLQAILVDQLESKIPKNTNRLNTIAFSLNRYSCLGIYGSHHCGKTHLIQQLVGEKGYWFGNIYIAGFERRKQIAQAFEHLGYCPQTKGFNDLLTPRELLTIFLMLNGISTTKRLQEIRNLRTALDLHKHVNIRMIDLPSNIKRRVNLALALVGHKDVLILDEPTKGLAAYDRLLIWNIIKYYRSLGNTIIFTTNESLELKELSDTIIIVNNGEMLLYDNIHNIEFQYNVGFYLEIKLLTDGVSAKEIEKNINTDVENLNRFMMFFHDESELLYRNGLLLKYYVPVENIIYSYIFGTIEKARNRLNIFDYTLTPFSLNNILLSLQKSHKEKRRHHRSKANLLKGPKILPKLE